MKYLITGHKGFIGTNLVNYLQLYGEVVEGIDRPDDLRTKVPSTSDIDVVVHLASETDVRRSIERPKLFFDSNISLMFSALQIAKMNNARLIFTSSCGASNPINPYAASKLACEALCQTYRHSYQMDISILRLSNVYGPHSKHKSSVIAKFIKQKLSNESVTIYGTGHQARDFIHVQDVCKAIYHVSDDFTVSTGRLTSINYVTELLGIKNIVYESPIIGEVFHPTTICWPGYEISLEQGLSETLKWFEEN